MTEGERLLIVEAPFTFTEIGKLENFARNLSWFMRRYPNTILLVVRGNGVRYVSQLPAPYWLQATYVYSLSWAAFEQKYLLGTAAAALPMAREKDAAENGTQQEKTTTDLAPLATDDAATNGGNHVPSAKNKDETKA